jgi:16S rRNA (guanine527-N7)-methyltransferase
VASRNDRDALAQGALSIGLDLTGLQLDRLENYLALLRAWAPRVNLLSSRDLPKVVARHVLDSLAPAPTLAKIGPSLAIADIGSGAGFPAVPLAIAVVPRRMVLVEVRRRRVSFLRAVARAIPELALEIRHGHASDLLAEEPRAFDGVVSRATLPLAELWPLAENLLRNGGELMVFRGPLQIAGASDAVTAPPQSLEMLPAVRYRVAGIDGELRIDRWRRRPWKT